MSSNIELRNINGKQLIYVEGDPFLILSFQLDCDSCYDAGTIDRMMKMCIRDSHYISCSVRLDG